MAVEEEEEADWPYPELLEEFPLGPLLLLGRFAGNLPPPLSGLSSFRFLELRKEARISESGQGQG